MKSLLKPWLTVCRVHTRTLDGTARKPDLAQGYSTRIVTRAELLRAALDPDMGLHAAGIDAALERGDLCAAAFHHDRMVAYVWRSFSTAPHVNGLWVTFERPYRYAYKAFTRPEHRGQGLQSALSFLTDRIGIERGYTQALWFVDNATPVARDSRPRPRVVGWAGYLRVFGRTYPFRTPGARRHTFGFVRRNEDQPASSLSGR